MNKTIISIFGRSGEGKSETIKNVAYIFETFYPTSSIRYLKNNGDILAVITIGGIKIGLESQGDPHSRIIYEDTLKDLIILDCDIIVCATRTSGMTVKKVDEIAAAHNYYTIWKSSYYTNGLQHKVLNQVAAEEIVNLIQSLIIQRL